MINRQTPLLEFPDLPSVMDMDSIPMGQTDNTAECVLDLPIAPGPFEPTWISIEKNYPGTPPWLREAKFGIWVHFGPQAAGGSGDWYARNLYKQGSKAWQNHVANFGHPSEVGYKDVLRSWNPHKLDPHALVEIYQNAGARFLFIQGVHHDNFDMWDSAYQPWNSVRLGAKRDFLKEWSTAAREVGMRYGITFHHEYTWWWWQTAFGSDQTGPKAGIPYDGHLTLADGKGKWWDGLDPRLLYGIDLREYKSVEKAAQSGWSPPDDGIFTRHLNYAKWYATWWSLRMMDAIEKYDPDLIYTDGTGLQPFSGTHTGTGLKADAMQRVIAHYYNLALKRRGKVDTFSIVKFRNTTNGTVNTRENEIPRQIKTDQAWIAEVPVGDWFYRDDLIYDSGMVIRYIIEAVARDGNAAVCICLMPDGSLDEGSKTMLKQIGQWMRRNGDAIYGSHAWHIAGEGQEVDGQLKMLPNGVLGTKHANCQFSTQDFRFTVGKDNTLYAFCMTVPDPGTRLEIQSLGRHDNHFGKDIKSVKLLGADATPLTWQQTDHALHILCPSEMPFETSVVFQIN